MQIAQRQLEFLRKLAAEIGILIKLRVERIRTVKFLSDDTRSAKDDGRSGVAALADHFFQAGHKASGIVPFAGSFSPCQTSLMPM